MPSESILDRVAGMGLGLRDTVVLVHAGIEYHVNAIMLCRFGTGSLESARMNAKLMSLNDTGVIDGVLRQDLIQIARIRHLFAHSLDADTGEVDRLLAGINRRGAVEKGRDAGPADGAELARKRFLAAARPSYQLIMERHAEMERQCTYDAQP